jgi:phenylpropionate dioxygenase-like ring-hydroxylating dioxygenase large terminal subunit
MIHRTACRTVTRGTHSGKQERERVSETQATIQAVDSQWLHDFWSPALHTSEVRGSRLATAQLLGIPLVLGRHAAMEELGP